MNLRVLLAVVWLAFVATALPTLAGQQAAPSASDVPRISVDVDLVELHATVTDRHGHLVTDLTQNNFQVYENGERQQIRVFRHEDVPVAAGLVVDHSGSMRTKLPEVSAAARTFVHSSNPDDQMFVVNFNEKVALGLPGAIRFSNSPAELENAISRAPAGGKTALYDSIVEALEHLKASNLDKKVLIVISDGGDNASSHKLAQVLKLAEQSTSIIYAVGIYDEDDPDRNPRVLSRLARETGGEAFFPKKLSAVVEICSSIARDIRSQYTIGYVPTNPTRTGGYRAIRVGARAPRHARLSVRTAREERKSPMIPGILGEQANRAWDKFEYCSPTTTRSFARGCGSYSNSSRISKL
jgi:Ca-activated chloride channel family protein